MTYGNEFSIIDVELTKSNHVLYNTIKAESGTHCKGKDRWGKNGRNIILKVPTGIRIRDSDTGKIIAEVDRHNEEIMIARGGTGGRGLRKCSSKRELSPTDFLRVRYQ